MGSWKKQLEARISQRLGRRQISETTDGQLGGDLNVPRASPA